MPIKELEQKNNWLNETFGKPVKQKINLPPDWRPMYPPRWGHGCPPSPYISPSGKQIKMIMKAIGSLNLDPNAVMFYLNNREDGKIRAKNISQLDNGDAWDIMETNVRKGIKGFKELIKGQVS